MELKSEFIEVSDSLGAVEVFFDRRWTDGLAIVPPTEQKVIQMIEYVGREPQESLGAIPPFLGEATIEKLAINTVMAGCLPEYFPVVIAAVEAMLDPKHNLNGTQTTQGCAEQLLIVNGPIVKKLGINAADGVFGRGYRANGTIGRAIRLILWNLGRNFPGEVDRSVLSHPGAWSYCIAENEAMSPWEPLHVERGFPPGSNAVTVFCCDAPHITNTFGTAEQVMRAICEATVNAGAGNYLFLHDTSELGVAISPLHAELLNREGWTKQRVKEYIWENARVSVKRLFDTGLPTAPHGGGSSGAERWPSWIDRTNPDFMVPPTVDPAAIHVVVCGGRGPISAILHGWGHGGGAITRGIHVPQ
jgi:hypothetical protein